MIKAAGVIFVCAGEVLLLKRTDGGDFPETWAFPGGKLEEGETALQAAKRECVEEMGICPEGSYQLFDMTENGEVEYTTYTCQVRTTFSPPKVDTSEHYGWVWVPIGEYGGLKLHPGALQSLEKLTVTELDIAEKVRDGVLPSPTRLKNSWFFTMRIFGTGLAYRGGPNKEWSLRDPALYLNERMLQRCSGMPVLIQHPDGTMDGDELAGRIVGTIMLPFLANSDTGMPSETPNEVWGVARVINEQAAMMLQKHVASTSPGVSFMSSAVNTKVPLESGAILLVESSPNVIDHLAICPVGVWDKGGEPSGVVISSYEENTMADEKKDEGSALEKLVTAIDSFSSRVDAMCSTQDALKERMDAMDKDRKDEKDRKDAEDKARCDAEEKAEKDRKDAEDKAEKDRKDEEATKAEAEAKAEKEKEVGDARNDSAALDERLKKLEAVTPVRSDEESEDLAQAQFKADSAYQAHGERAPAALAGESKVAYRRRLLQKFTGMSTVFKDIDLRNIGDVKALDAMGEVIYQDAINAAKNPASFQDDELRARHSVDEATGRRITTFHGRRASWLDDFRMPIRGLKQINKEA